MLLYAALLIPILLAAGHEFTGKYPFSAAVTISCAGIVLLCGKPQLTWPVVIGLAFSVAGDYFMAHQKAGGMQLLYGIGFFFCAHALFCVYSLKDLRPSLFLWIFGAAVFAVLGVYIFRRVLPRLHAMPIRAGLIFYAGISALSLALASSRKGEPLEVILFFTAILLIAVSDVFIAESDFCHTPKVGKWICPLYYACHIAMTASVITRVAIR